MVDAQTAGLTVEKLPSKREKSAIVRQAHLIKRAPGVEGVLYYEADVSALCKEVF